MKYIVSIYESRIYEVEDEFTDPHGTHWYSCESGTIQLEAKEVVKEVEDLLELFDDFVLVAPYRFRRPKTATELDKDFDDMIYFYTDKDDTIYGSIWNGPDLKAVAEWDREREKWRLL